MDNKILLVFISGVVLSLITALGDSFVKRASLSSGFSGWKILLLGAVIGGG